MARRHERPIPFINPSGKKVWKARWTDKTGKRRHGWPPDIAGTHALRKDAQDAITACYEREAEGPARPGTVGTYAETWQKVHPRARVTDKTNRSRLNAVLDVKLEGAALRDWPFDQLRRRHANLLVDHMFREQGRAYTGIVNIIGTLSAMAEDAIDDEVAVANPFKGVKVRANDPRATKLRRPVRVFSFEEMRGFARSCAMAEDYGPEINAWRRVYAEPMVRLLSDCGLRAGELLGLERRDLDAKEGTLRVERTVSLGEVIDGVKGSHGEIGSGRTVPVPPELLAMLAGMPRRIDTALLFPTPRGCVWNYSTWWKFVWQPGREAAGLDIRPHEMRHSWVSIMRAAGVDVADLAQMAGHTPETATKTYTHALGRSFEAVRKVAEG